jgi:hypothetical protein
MRTQGCIAASLVVIALTPVAASDTTKIVTVSATFAAKTSLKVSSDVLLFNVAGPDGVAVATVDFAAGARTRDGGEVVLSVEALRALAGPGGAADVDASVTFAGDGNGTHTGALAPHLQAVAGRWMGSGMRRGRIVFTLRARTPGQYSVPVRFALMTP